MKDGRCMAKRCTIGDWHCGDCMREELMTIAYDEAFRQTFEECNLDRCQRKSMYGQCHLRNGHSGGCDELGESHTT